MQKRENQVHTLKVVSFGVELGAAFWGDEVEGFAALAASALLVVGSFNAV